MRGLREEVAVLKHVVGASFDMPLDVQRAIRQEASAVLAQGGDTGGGVPTVGAPLGSAAVDASQLAARGNCIVCLENAVDEGRFENEPMAA